MSARQCLKRLHLEINQANLAKVSAATEAALRTGLQVGDIARQIYGNEDSVYIPHAAGLTHALQKTRRLIDAGPRFPIFEATFQYGGLLVRIDVLLPDDGGWRIVEVKASTTIKEVHTFDCAIQSWVFRSLGHTLNRVSLAHVDNSFVYQGDNDYRGLLLEREISEQVDLLAPTVPDWAAAARKVMGPVEPDIPVGSHCNQPYDCPFIHYCWPSGSDYPVQQLPRASRAKLATFIAEGLVDLRDVPAVRLTANQRRVQRIVRSGHAELLPGAKEFLESLAYPRYYLDFETVAPAVPIWADTRPYEVLPFQWSCHFEADPGQVEHAEFLDLSGQAPMRLFAESLIRGVGKDGPILVYSGYEKTVLRKLGERFSDLRAALVDIVARLVDLAPLTEQNFYAPSMAGSWSLKAVTPAISSDLDYSKLVGIQDGTAASEGYLEAIDEATDSQRKAQLKQQLLDYCRYDTLAIVRLARFLSGAATD